jgi:hypothetical protein
MWDERYNYEPIVNSSVVVLPMYSDVRCVDVLSCKTISMSFTLSSGSDELRVQR